MKKICQSCGMPLSRDPQGGGTEKSGAKSLKYCSRCYSKGKFSLPHLTAEGMQKLVQEKMKAMKIPRWISWFFTKAIPQLDRWKQTRR